MRWGRGRLNRLCEQVGWQHRYGEPVRSLNRTPASKLDQHQGSGTGYLCFHPPLLHLSFLHLSASVPCFSISSSPVSLPVPSAVFHSSPSHVSFLYLFIPLALPPQSFPTPSLPTQHLFLLSFLSPPPWAFYAKTSSQ